eukprot:gene24557-biopygen1388
MWCCSSPRTTPGSQVGGCQGCVESRVAGAGNPHRRRCQVPQSRGAGAPRGSLLRRGQFPAVLICVHSHFWQLQYAAARAQRAPPELPATQNTEMLEVLEHSSRTVGQLITLTTLHSTRFLRCRSHGQ